MKCFHPNKKRKILEIEQEKFDKLLEIEQAKFDKLLVLIKDGETDRVTNLMLYYPDLFDKKSKYFGETALHKAAEWGQEGIVLLLLKFKPDLVTILDSFDHYPLDLAIICGREKIVELLLELCPSLIDAIGDDGATPLHLAANNGKTEIAKLLLALKPGLIDALDKAGKSAFYSAVKSDWSSKEIIELLRDKTSIDQILKTYTSLKNTYFLKEFQKQIIEHSAPLLAEFLPSDLTIIVQEYIVEWNDPVGVLSEPLSLMGQYDEQ